MRKRVIMAFSLAMALAFAPVSGELSMTVNAAGNTTGSDTATAPMSVSGGDAVRRSTEGSTDNTLLAAPTGVQCNGGIVTWNAVEGAVEYHVETLRSDGGVGSAYVKNTTLDYRMFINESGVYKFRVYSRTTNSGDDVGGQWSEWSEEYNYVKPDCIIESPGCYWSDTNPGTICWQPVEGASGYMVHLYCIDRDAERDPRVGVYWNYDMNETSYDFIKQIKRNGEGRYYCIVTAYSADIETMANGVEGTPSRNYKYVDTTASADTVGGIISGAMGGATSAKALETIKSKIDKTDLRNAMQTDDTVLGQIRDLESAYAAEQGIKVNTPTVSKDAGAYVSADAISVVGVGLNAAAGQEVRLEVSVPTAEKVVPMKYFANTVQLEIQLKRNGESVHELDIPITITMPIPKGLDAKQLVILHYGENDNYTTVNFKNNGDGTVTFTVSRFSTFVFAEQKTGNGNGDSAAYNSGDVDALDIQEEIADWIVNAASGEVIRVKGVSALSNSIMQELLKRSDVSLVLEYTYEGVDYVVTIPAGAAVNDDVPWYGPLYLAGRYGNGVTGAAGATGASYTVQAGDTMTKIARAHGMTLNQLAEKNPQVKNLNYIVVGQKINVR